MRLWTIARTHCAVWSSPLLFFVVWRFVSAQSAPEAGPYSLPTTSISLWAIAFIGPMSSASAAWEAGRLRRGGVFFFPAVRARPEVLVASVGPTVVVATVAMVIGHLVRVEMTETWVAPEPRLSLVAFTVVLAQTAFGFALGTRLTAPIAVPLALVAPLLWMIGTAAVDPPWVRHLSGTWANCCRLHEEIAPGALWAPWFLALSLLVTSLVSLHPGLNGRVAALAALAVVPVSVAALISPLVNDLSSSPVVARPHEELVCGTGEILLCVWPENQERLDSLSLLVDRTSDAWRAVGVPLAKGFTEQRGSQVADDYASLRIAANSTDHDVVMSLADAILGAPPICPEVADRPAHLGGRLYPTLVVYLAMAAGVPADALGARFAPRDLTTAASALNLSADEQRTWVTDAFQAWTTCNTSPPIPGGAR